MRRRWAAFFHTYEIHSPYEPPEAYVDLFGEFTSSIRPTWPSLRRFNQQPKKRLDQADLDFLVSQYDGEIRSVDDCIRELFSRLTEIGFLDNAVVLITSDRDLAAALEVDLEAWRNARPHLGDDADSITELDPSTEERLRALGYLD